MRYGSKWPEYARQWDAMVINPSRAAEFERLAKFAVDNKARYQAIEALTGVTWPHIAVLHRRESDADFDTYLGNGEPLNRVTRLVPKGRGPFTGADAFEKGAIDALHLDGLDAVPDWRLEKILYYCEVFNGAGYANHGLPSPYVWGGTNQQRPGKYPSDGVFDPNIMDTQPGCAPILAMIAKLDPTVQFIRETPMGVEPTGPAMPPVIIPPGQIDATQFNDMLKPFLAEVAKAAGPILLQLLQQAIAGQPGQPLALPKPVVTVAQPAPPAIEVPPAGMIPAPSGLGTALSIALPFITKALPATGVWGSIASAALLAATQFMGVVGPAVGATATPTGGVLTTGVAATGAASLFAWIAQRFNPGKPS